MLRPVPATPRSDLLLTMLVPRTHLLLRPHTHSRWLWSHRNVCLATFALGAATLTILIPLHIPAPVFIYTDTCGLANRAALQIDIEIHVGGRAA
jgi:hypothetical protein